MRVLIISLPRTGSTTLLNEIYKDKKMIRLFEPFDGTNRVNYHSNLKNVVVKTIICQYPTHIQPDSDSIIEWLIEFSKQFDEVILLSRKNLKECAESHAFRVFNKNKLFRLDLSNNLIIEIKCSTDHI